MRQLEHLIGSGSVEDEALSCLEGSLSVSCVESMVLLNSHFFVMMRIWLTLRT